MTTAGALWPRRAAVAAGAWVLVCGVSLLLGLRPHPVLLALVLAAAGATLLLFLDTSGGGEAGRWNMADSDPVRPPGEDPGLAALTRVVGAHLVAHDVGPSLHRHLVRLVDQRLVAHHGISLQADPDRAAALIGPELTAVVAQGPPYPRLSIDQIDVLIDRIEDL